MQKDPLQLDFTDHCSVNFLMIFICRFGDCMNIYLPFIRLIFEPLVFGLIIPDITTEITCARANLKPMTGTKQLPHLDIFSMHDQNDFISVGVIPM